MKKYKLACIFLLFCWNCIS